MICIPQVANNHYPTLSRNHQWTGKTVPMVFETQNSGKKEAAVLSVYPTVSKMQQDHITATKKQGDHADFHHFVYVFFQVAHQVVGYGQEETSCLMPLE